MGRAENKGRSQPRRLDRFKRTTEIVDRSPCDLFITLRPALSAPAPFEMTISPKPGAMRDFSAGSINLYWGPQRLPTLPGDSDADASRDFPQDLARGGR